MREAERLIRILRAGLEDAISCLETWGESIPKSEKERYGFSDDLVRLREIHSGQLNPWWAHAHWALLPNGELW